MKKKILSLALVAGAMMGATTIAPEATKAYAEQQVKEANQTAKGAPEQQQPAKSSQRQQSTTEAFKEFGMALGNAVPTHYANQSRRFYRNVSNGHGGGYNKVTHSRRTKRKHRRA